MDLRVVLFMGPFRFKIRILHCGCIVVKKKQKVQVIKEFVINICLIRDNWNRSEREKESKRFRSVVVFWFWLIEKSKFKVRLSLSLSCYNLINHLLRLTVCWGMKVTLRVRLQRHTRPFLLFFSTNLALTEMQIGPTILVNFSNFPPELYFFWCIFRFLHFSDMCNWQKLNLLYWQWFITCLCYNYIQLTIIAKIIV